MSVISLKGITNIGDSLLADQLETNLATFFDYTTLAKGAWFDVNIPTSGAYGGNYHKLRLGEDPSYNKGQIWHGARGGWIWESGISNNGLSPIKISGVYVDNTFYPIGTTGTYAYKIDYTNSRIIFDTAISANAIVHCEYSHKWFSWFTADHDWFREVQFDSFRVDNSHYLQYGSGVWATLSQNQVQLPTTIVEVGGRRSFKGAELGGGQKVFQDVYFHIFSQDHWLRKQLLDIISYQNDKTIFLFNKNTLNFPLNMDGTLVAKPKTYPDYVAETGAGGHLWKGAILRDMSLVNTFHRPPLYGATVRTTVEVWLGEI